MFLAFYRSLTKGWRVGLTESVEGSSVVLQDGGIEETVSKSDVYIPPKDAEQLLSMSDNPSIFLQQRDAALMSPSPLIALPPLIELLRYRIAKDEMETDIGDNFTLLIGEGSVLDVNPPGYETALRACLAWRASGQRQAIVNCGYTHPNIYDGLFTTTAKLLGATREQLRIIAAGLRVISSFTTTIDNCRLCYAQGHVYADSYGESVAAVRFDCDHLYTSGISQSNDFNFKIFAYMLYGLSAEEREHFLFCRKQKDFVCQTSLRDPWVLARMRKEYAAFTEAAAILGIPSSTLRSFLNRVAAVVHLTEIEFYEDGTSSNLPALRSAARLLQLDFQQCLEVFTTRGACVAGAQLLYDATVAMLVRRVNAAMQFVSGDLQESSVSLLLFPPPPPAESDELERLFPAIVYEDLGQAFIRASDRETVQWQRAGRALSPDLSALLDELDNYSLLKVLRGLGGVLSVAQCADPAPEALRVALASCARHASVRLDAATLSLTVSHSFGTRRYQFPRGAAAHIQRRSAGHDAYAPVRALLRDGADADTQECLHALAQRDGAMPATALEHEARRARGVLAVLQDGAVALWWLHRAPATGAALGDALQALHARAARQLRRFVPRRLLACPPARLARVQHAPGAAGGAPVLLDGAALAQLHRAAMDSKAAAARVVQALARQRGAALAVARRRDAIAAAVAAASSRSTAAVAAHKAQAMAQTRAGDATALSGAALAALLRDEAAARARLRSAAWEGITRLEDDARGVAADALSAALAAKVKSITTAIRALSGRTVQRARRGTSPRRVPTPVARSIEALEKERAMDAFVARRLAAHRARLDSEIAAAAHLAARSAERGAAAAQRRERAAEAAGDARRSAAEAYRRRAETSVRVVKSREAERSARQERNAARSDRQRAARERRDAALEAYGEALRAQHAVQDMEARAMQRLRSEAAAFRRQQSAVVVRRTEEDRQRRGAERAAAERTAFAQELRAARRAAGEAAVSGRHSGERPKARNTARVANANSGGSGNPYSRALRRAETELTNPRLFEQRPNGTVAVRRSALLSSPSEPFILGSGTKSYARAFSDTSMRGLFAFQTAKSSAKTPHSSATGAGKK